MKTNVTRASLGNPLPSDPRSAGCGGQSPCDAEAKAGNGNLNFLLAGYTNPMAMPGVVPTPQVAAESLMAMYRRAKSEAYRAGAVDPSHDAEEGLSKAIHAIGKSRLTETYRLSPNGVAPWANVAICRSVRHVVAEKRRYRSVPIMEQSASKECDPAESAEFADLTTKCDELLDGHSFFVPALFPPDEQQTSTRYVQKHRQRQAAWNILAPLFPGVSFRPHRRQK